MEYENGRKQDVLFEDIFIEDKKTGLLQKDKYIKLWADKNLLQIIEAVDGVVRAFNHQKDSEYAVLIDPRYDAEIVKKEIEAAIICRPSA
jgi:hypothetical protein